MWKRERYISLDLKLISQSESFYRLAYLSSHSSNYIVDTAVKLENYVSCPNPFHMTLLSWSRFVHNLRNPLRECDGLRKNGLEPCSRCPSLCSLKRVHPPLYSPLPGCKVGPSSPFCICLRRYSHHLVCSSPLLLLHSLLTILLGY